MTFAKPTLTAPTQKDHWSADRFWPFSWQYFACPDTEQEAARLVTECGKRLDRMIATIRGLHVGGDAREAKVVRRLVLASASARVAAVARAGTKAGRLWSAKRVVQEGLGLNMWRLPPEPVHRVYVEKNNGQYRVTYRFYVLGGARNYLGARVAQIFCRFSGQQFGTKGGTPGIAKWLETTMAPSDVAVTTDMPNHFHSLNRERVENDGHLPVPVLRSLLFDTMQVAKNHKGPLSLRGLLSSKGAAFYGPELDLGRGVPPGSALAALAAEQRMASLLHAVETAVPDVKVSAYSDNIIMLAPTPEAARASKSALFQAVLEEYGPEIAERVRVRTNIKAVRFGFVFLKDHYRLTDQGLRRRMTQGAMDWIIRLSTRAYEEGWSKSQVSRSLAGWLRARSYDPRAFEAAHCVLRSYGISEDISDLEMASADTWGSDDFFLDMDDALPMDFWDQ